MSDKPLIGRCERCNFALFAMPDQIKDVNDWSEVKPGLPYRLTWGIFARCNNGHKVFRLKQIKGTYSADHKCDARCLNAKGNSCTCSCGGMNHGRGHAITLTTAREPEFVGEVGKTIRGEVTVFDARELINLKLYDFRTKEGNRITWFARPDFDPGFEQGEKLTIRARVKKHEDHEQYGKATIVTYVEEV